MHGIAGFIPIELGILDIRSTMWQRIALWIHRN
jgi:hypothetical protein